MKWPLLIFIFLILSSCSSFIRYIDEAHEQAKIDNRPTPQKQVKKQYCGADKRSTSCYSDDKSLKP